MIDLLGPEFSLRQNRAGDTVAPHKPLLILLALARLQRGEPRLMTYQELETDLKDLLLKYSNKTENLHLEYPFWRLRNDRNGEFWDIPRADEVKQNKSGDASRTQLIHDQIKGGFSQEIFEMLRERPQLASQFGQRILDESFPESLHEAIKDDIALVTCWHEESTRRKRDPSFARKVLESYRFACAVCRYGTRIGHAPKGIEAAHIKWHCYNGPDEECNGVALCSLHHKAFDSGGIGLTDDCSILISKSLNGAGSVDAFFRFEGRSIFAPSIERDRPSIEFIRWHRKEIFRSDFNGSQ